MAPRRNAIQENQQISRNEDMISWLPDDLLLHILSFVDMKLAMQTSILSKRWRNVWTSLGSITINANQYYSSATTRRVIDFIRFVYQVFDRRDNPTIDVFSFTYYYHQDPIGSSLYNWIILATQRRVQQMYLRLCGDIFVLPDYLFSCDSLIALALAFSVKKERPRPRLHLTDSMDLPELRSLLLGSVIFYNEKLTNKLFLSCPKLERLFLGDVEYQGVNVDIFSHTLVELGVNNHINDYSDSYWINNSEFKFKLHAPNLKFLECKDFMPRDYILENLNSLIRADVDMKVEQCIEKYGVQFPFFAKRKQIYGQRMMRFLRALHKVEYLKLSPWFLEVISGSPDLLDCHPTQFYSLKYLKLETWLSRGNIRAITYLLQISPILESLFLEISKIKFGSSKLGENPEAEVSFTCLLDKLVLVEIRGVVGCMNELLFLEILLKNAKVLKKLVVYISKEDSSNREERMTKFYEKLLTFQKASSDIKILFY